MPVREAGSYTVDPTTGDEQLVQRTDQPDGSRLEETVPPAPDVPTAPAGDPVPAEPAAPAQE